MTSADASGFAAAKEGLKAISGRTQWINQQVGSGKLSLDPDVADKAAKRCEEEIRELARLLRDSDQITRLSGLGNYPDGQQLTQRFVDKASAPGAGALDLVRQLQDELQKQADAFRAAAKDYRATDEQISDDLQRGIK
ncbi:hypothetical protein AB0L88_28345 [Saccharopolyspora shandongensis]|uniref:Excreted virulence factor EspC, type VII ESX diderm n=1 Tax=Saccharopolyspora shandongensis TaxID=418495 RepID=A0A1H2VBZ9_9PSEU|nr:hypothetical protein [Saccharopolyspora shandongensis]SDW65856.1 hypothetical protein SAMN05216215_1004269 [Saccharopolyspora shandongensis]